MENKNGVVVFYVLFLVIGVFVGWLICSNKNVSYDQTSGMHQMDNGQMMNNVGMDMDSMMRGMMMSLQDKTGDDFDKSFLSEMIMHHEGAVVMAQMVLKTSKRPELLQLANDIISAQTKEIEMMEGWQKAWFK
jgi:uncharacterized protein (DUF305 family)